MNEKFKNFIVHTIHSSELPHLKKYDIITAMIQEFGLSERSAKIHIRKFIKEHCQGKDRLAYHFEISKHREIFSRENVWDDIKHLIIKPGSTRWKMRKY